MNNTCGIKMLAVVITLITTTSIYSQDTTAHLLPEFSVSEKLDKMLSKVNNQEIDSSTIANYNTSNLSTLLSKNSAITVRSYGVTGISSVAMRGGNSNHTAVLWNGFNLQDPLNGGFNFSSSSSNLVDKVNIQHGGSSAAFGSGAVGGTIHLDNTPLFNNKLYGSILYKNGSFGLNSTNIEIGHGGKKLASRIRIYGHIIKNNFEFENKAKKNNPSEFFNNAEIKRIGILHEFYYKIKPNQIISSQFWYQNNFREIPPNITSERIANEKEYMKDDWYRWAINWNKKGEKVNWEARTGTFYNLSEYYNTAIDLESKNNSLKNITEAIAFIKIKNTHQLSIGFNNNYTVGLSDNFYNTPTLNTTALYLAPSFILFKKLTINTSFREEYYNEKFKPITFAFNSKLFFYKNLFLTASFSKNYRTPNFNDLYWSGGNSRGNLNLKSEHGYSKDIGLGLHSQAEKIEINSSISFYQNNINDQIQWIPEGQTWTPFNIKEVETIGVEFLFKSKFRLSKKINLIANLNYSYTDAQVKAKSDLESESVLDKQLIYIPYYQANSLLGISFVNTSLNIGNQYVGYQFTRADNLEFLPSYFISDLGIEQNIKGKKTDILFFGKLNNLFNVVYEVRQWYPMPKMNYEIGFKLLLK
jgi:iron complex outermembrane recepter protein